MLDRIKLAILRYFKENLDDLLKFDMKLARVLGAPAPHTLSSYAYDLEKRGKLTGKVFRPVIDALFRWLLNQNEHCKQAYEGLNASNA